jgi:hypothetical protein
MINKDLICWTGDHYLHMSFGVLFVLLLLAIVYPTTALFYEDTCTASSAYRKISSDAELSEITFKLLLTVSALLFNYVRVFGNR